MLAPWMTEYDLRSYGSMQMDSVRMDAYVAALRAAVTPGCTVLDLGTGAGVMALLAARMGAGRVVGVDTSPVIEVARRNAVACGLADRVEFVQADSRALRLPEPVDVVVSDIRGVLPPLHQNAAVLQDARTRLLRPGGVLIPLRDELLVAPVHLPGEYRRLSDAWSVGGLDLAPAREAVLNEWRKGPVEPGSLAGEPAVWAVIDYPAWSPGTLRGSAGWVIDREVEAHGLAGWFRTELMPGIGFTSGPGSGTVYGTAFFPWPRPVQLSPGDRVQVTLSVHSPGVDLVWVWRTRIERQGAPPIEFDQSPAAMFPPAMEAMRRRGTDHRPELGARGAAALWVLQSAGSGSTLGVIAEALRGEFPALFPRLSDALTFAAELLESYGA